MMASMVLELSERAHRPDRSVEAQPTRDAASLAALLSTFESPASRRLCADEGPGGVGGRAGARLRRP